MSGQETDKCTVVRSDLDALFPALRKYGFSPMGPTVREGAIVYDSIESTSDLPAGWTDQQQPGQYRLAPRNDPALFGYAVGPSSWKRFLHPPAVRLFHIERQNGDPWRITPGEDPPQPMAFIGVRACELHALSIRDRVLLNGKYPDPDYRRARQSIFIVAVHCSAPADTCFCTSMKAGPRCPDAFDLALTEILDGEHRFLVETGTPQGRKILKEIPRRPATAEDLTAAEAVLAKATQSIRRTLDTRGLKQMLYASIEHPRFEQTGKRCLACGSCTMVCPTCFCTTVEDTSALDGASAERWRLWDTCFSQQFSYIHGGSIRNSTAARLRHRITHKFASWWDQFGSGGCTGCGRCTTWCPAGIDVTEELRAIRESTAGGAL